MPVKKFYSISAAFLFFGHLTAFSATLLPSPFHLPTQPSPGSASCKSCAGDNAENPSLNNDGAAALTVNLSDFLPVKNTLLTIRLGTQFSFFPSEEYQLLPPGSKGGDKDFLIAKIGRKKIGFKAEINKMGAASFYSVNYPGFSIRRDGEFLALTDNKKGLRYLFSSRDGGYQWKIAGVRDKNFPARQIRCKYDEKGYLNAVVLPDDTAYTLEYKDGLPVRVSDPAGAVTEIIWDERSHIKRVKTSLLPKHPFHPGGKFRGKLFVIRDIHAECDAHGRLLSLVNTDGEKFIAEYRSDKDKKKKTSYFCGILKYPDKRTIYCRLLWNGAKNALYPKTIEQGWVTLDENGKEKFTSAKKFHFKKKSNTLVLFSKKLKGREHKIRRDHKTMAITGRTDPLGRTTSYMYNDRGLKTAVINPDRSSKSFRYNNKNRLIELKDELNRITKYTYNKKGSLVEVNESGIIIRYEYDQQSRPVKTILPDGTVHTFSWDSLFRMTSRTRPDGTTSRYEYAKGINAILRIDTVSSDSKQIYYKRKFAYDPNGRLAKISYPDKTSEKFYYDCCNLIKTVDRAGAVTKFAYDSSHRKVLKISPNKEKTAYKYNNRNKLLAVIHPDRLSTLNEYDQYGNLIKRINPDKTWVKYQYDIVNRKIKAVHSDGTGSSFKYDERDRLLAISGDRSENMRYTYNAVGEMVSVSNHGLPVVLKGRKTVYKYDKMGRKTALVLPDGSRKTNYYAGNSRKLKGTLYKGIITSYKYDKAGRIIAVSKYSKEELKNSAFGVFDKNIIETRTYDLFGNLYEIRRAVEDETSLPLTKKN